MLKVEKSPSLTLSNLDKQNAVEELVKPLILSDETIKRIRDAFESEMAIGLSLDPAKKSSLQMENTFVTELLDGTENGEFLALDLGGTNFRVLFIELKSGKLEKELVKYYAVPENVRIGEGAALFDFLADCIHNFMTIHNMMQKSLPLGFCFSFPVTQNALDSGTLVTWTKSFNCPDAVGKDAVQMLNDAIRRKGDMEVDVVAIVNDTTGTLVKGTLVDRNCAIGMVLATGSNACYLERVDRIGKWIGDRPGVEEVVVDTEWGAFGDNGVLDFVKTEYDRAVNEHSLLVNSFTFEKLLSGKFLGEVVRQVMLKLIKERLLFNGRLTEELEQLNSFTTTDVSHIEGENGDSEVCTIFRERFGYDEISNDDISIIKYVCAIASLRGACLVSICLSSLIERMDKPKVTIAVDGSLYKYHPRYGPSMVEFITKMAPGKKFEFILVEDGSGKGAGLVAAVAMRVRQINL
ncbi:hexokinase-4-like [Centruroides vittatus]|uniref:hexokinase-4-like n=1 Tax=Centruroides vittatus TaxID=120091 RepID=UPI0035106FED